MAGKNLRKKIQPGSGKYEVSSFSTHFLLKIGSAI
jgi:hypothetical protein